MSNEINLPDPVLDDNEWNPLNQYPEGVPIIRDCLDQLIFMLEFQYGKDNPNLKVNRKYLEATMAKKYFEDMYPI